MKRHLLFWVAALMLCCLAACQTTPPAPPPEIHYVVVRPSEDMLKDCDNNATPPDPDAYKAASDKEQKRMLTNYGLAVNAERKACAVRWPALRQWLKDQENIYSKPIQKP